MVKALFVFGTRPEIIKLAPVIQEMENFWPAIKPITFHTGQHTDMAKPILDFL